MRLETANLCKIENLDFKYTLGSQKVQALRNISLSITKGSFTCLSGPSGSGKSTLLNLIGLIEPPQSGKLMFLDKDVRSLTERDKNRLRRFEIGFIFQTFQLFPILSAEENVEFFLVRQGLAYSDRKERVKHALGAVGLWEHRTKRPLEMSGGQRQRVALARAIAKSPKVIIADEPTASLDQATGREIMEIFKHLNEKEHVTIIVSSHDPMVHGYVREHIGLRDGQIV